MWPSAFTLSLRTLVEREWSCEASLWCHPGKPCREKVSRATVLCPPVTCLPFGGVAQFLLPGSLVTSSPPQITVCWAYLVPCGEFLDSPPSVELCAVCLRAVLASCASSALQGHREHHKNRHVPSSKLRDMSVV